MMFHEVSRFTALQSLSLGMSLMLGFAYKMSFGELSTIEKRLGDSCRQSISWLGHLTNLTSLELSFQLAVRT
jgi:hypothetical protein